jgi:hypothetical protein
MTPAIKVSVQMVPLEKSITYRNKLRNKNTEHFERYLSAI